MQTSLIIPVILLFLAAILLIALVVVVILAQHREYLHYFFALFMAASAVWATGLGVFLLTRSPDLAYIAATIYYIAAAVIVYALLLLVLAMPTKRLKLESNVVVGRLGLLLTVPILVMVFFSLLPNGIIRSITINLQNTAELQSVGYTVYTIIFLIYSATSTSLLFYKLHHTKEPRYRRQLLYIAGSALFGIGFGSFFDLILPLLGNYYLIWVGPLCGIPVVATIFYSIIRHGLFDIRRVVVRTVTYILSLATLALIYYILAFAISELLIRQSGSAVQNTISAAIALVMAFIFQPIRRFFDRITNKVFYKDNYNADDFFARLNKALTFTTDLRGLLERAADEIALTLKSEQAFLFINTSDGHYVSAGTSKHKQLPKNDAIQLGTVEDKNNGVIMASLRETSDPIRRLMLSHRIELVLPLTQDNEVIGLLCLGEHLTSNSYTNHDIKVLNTISDELTIAIQNALAVQEIREFNVTLQQRIQNATKELRTSNTQLRRLDKAKDEFVSMASHQLRTPLTSVKGYISMVIEGDAGKITDAQKNLLDEAFNSSERMVHLINDFLNISRIQTGKFIIDKHPVDLSKIVEQEIDDLSPNAAARNLEYVYNPPKNFPMMNVDESKIRQVIMNFADNSLYYSHENTKIMINLSVEDNDALFTVKDTGIGVPADEQSELFSKFYRASNARKQRPDGTGVGLFLAKKVINAHGGRVVFESVEDKGSTFGFRLPIK